MPEYISIEERIAKLNDRDGHLFDDVKFIIDSEDLLSLSGITPPDEYDYVSLNIYNILMMPSNNNSKNQKLRAYLTAFAIGNSGCIRSGFHRDDKEILVKELLSLVQPKKDKKHINRKNEQSMRKRRFHYIQKYKRCDKFKRCYLSGRRGTLKQQTNKRLRQQSRRSRWMPPDIFSQHRGYRRILDYWWELH